MQLELSASLTARLSGEQKHLVREFLDGKHVLARAVAGAGKTTVLLECGKAKPNLRFLLLTYNKRLQLEVAERAKASAPNVQVSTYHSAAGKAYDTLIKTDREFANALALPPPKPQTFDVLMLDEAQDLIAAYFAFVQLLLLVNTNAQLLVVGDERQAIGEYRGACSEFLTRAPELFARTLGETRPWSSCVLRESYRMTPSIAEFVNAELFKADVIVGKNLSLGQGPKPVYYAVNGGVLEHAAVLGRVTRAAVDAFGPEGVFILAPSVRDLANKCTPLAMLVQRHLSGILTYVASNDGEEMDARTSHGKLAIMTYNASKGCERPCVILAGFDETYFQFYGKQWSQTNLPNVLTVAATRAKVSLIVVAQANKTLRGVGCDSLPLTASVVGKPLHPSVHRPPSFRQRNFTVKSLIRHLTVECLNRALRCVQVSEPEEDLTERLKSLAPLAPQPQSTVCFGAYFESLAFVYGILAPVLAEVALTGTTTFAEGLEAPKVVHACAVKPLNNTISWEDLSAYPPCFWENLRTCASTPIEKRTPVQWAVLAVASHAFVEGRHHIARQVPHYRWVNPRALKESVETVLAALKPNGVFIGGHFEVNLSPVDLGTKTIVGRADFIDAKRRVWEFKLNTFSDSDVLQLGCYLALRGGGEGVLLSLRERRAVTVTVAPEKAWTLLETLACRAEVEAGDVALTIAAFDVGVKVKT